MLELHAIRYFGQRVVTGEVANAALGALALGHVANDEDRALVLRIVGGDLRGGDGDGSGLAMPRPNYHLARVLRGAQHVEFVAIALVEDGHDGPADQLFFAPRE